MIFNSLFKEDESGPPCIKCGSRRSGLSTITRRSEAYKWVTITICEECLFKAVVGDVAFHRAVNAASQPLVSAGDEVKLGTLEYLSLIEQAEVKPKKWWQL